MQAVGTVAFVIAILATGRWPRLEPSVLPWGIALAALGAASLLMLYRGLALGPIAVVSPIVAGYTAVTVGLLVVVLGERLTTGEAAAVAATFIGVLIASTDLRSVRALIGRPLPGTWIAAVVDQNMIQIARSRDSARFVGLPATETTQAAIRAGRTTPYAAVSRDGISMTASVARVTGTQWTVVVAAPSTSLDSDVWRAFQSTLWIGLFCAILSAFGAWFLARSLRTQIHTAASTVTAQDKDHS